MMKKNNKEELEKDLLTLDSLSTDNHEEILSLSDKYDIPRPKNYQCPNCWDDQIILIKIEIRNRLQTTEGKKYILRSNVDVIWKGIRINADTLTDELAKKYIEDGFPITFFKSIPKKKK